MEEIEKKLDIIINYLFMIKVRIDDLLSEYDDGLSQIPVLETDFMDFMEPDS